MWEIFMRDMERDFYERVMEGETFMGEIWRDTGRYFS